MVYSRVQSRIEGVYSMLIGGQLNSAPSLGA